MAEPVTFPYRSFAAGEISPALTGRTDQTKYQTGLEVCRNWATRLEGSVENRSGFAFVAPLLRFANQRPRMIPFVFNDDQAYILVLHYDGSLYVRFYVLKDGFPITYTAKNVEGATSDNPVVVTSTAHGYAGGELVYIEGVQGITEINGRFFRVGAVTANTFALQEEANVDGSGYGAFTITGPPGTVSQAVETTLGSYAAADLDGLRYKQSGDVLFVTHPNHHELAISRVSETSWTVTPTTYEPDIDAPEGGAASGTAGADTVRYQVTAVDEDTLEESFAGFGNAKAFTSLSKGGGVPVTVTTTTNHLYTTGDWVVFRDIVNPDFTFLNGSIYKITVSTPTLFWLDNTTDGGVYVGAVAPAGSVENNQILVASITFPSSGNPITITWDAVAGALDYNIYREINGIFGYIGTSATTSFEDLGYTVDAFDTPPIQRDIMNEAGEYPTAVGFYQQSKMLGGSENDPEGVRKSRTGLYNNYSSSNPVQDDDAFRFVMASGQVNAVRHFLDMGRLLVFTAGAVFSIEGDEAGTLRPTDINARLRSEQGSGNIPPLPVNDVALFVQSSGKLVRELVPDTGDRYQSNDLTVFSKHLLKTYAIERWTYAEEPNSVAWMVRADGVLLGLTYMRQHEILGWHRHDTGDGDEILDVCAIPEANETILYVAVRRYNCNGQTRVYIERMHTRQGITEPTDGRFLDSFISYDGRNTAAGNTYQLSFNTTYEAVNSWWIAPTGGTGPFVVGGSSPDIGKAIVLYVGDDEIRCTITEIYNAFAAAVTIEGSTTSLMLPYQTAAWGMALPSIDGLWHLNGRQVYALGDGSQLGPFTVSQGSISLGATYAQIVSGLQIIADLKTLEPDNVQGETWVDKEKTISDLTVRVEATSGLQVGLDEASLQDWSDQWAPGHIVDGELFTGKLRVTNQGRIDATGQVMIRQSAPLPATVLGIYPRVELGRP